MIHSLKLSELARRTTPDMARAQAMGYALERADVYLTSEGLKMRGQLRCVCGGVERFDFVMEIPPEALDPARLLREAGAFERAHLQNDGYSDADIDTILEKGAAYDLAHP